MSVFADAVDRYFLERLMAGVAQADPTVEGLSDRILACVKRAEAYGIRAKDDIEWFVGLDLKRGFEWEKAAGMEFAIDILDSPRVDVAGRRYRLEKMLRKWDGDAD